MLPEPIRGFVGAGSKALGVDPSYLGTAVLPVLAAAVGNAAVIRLKPGWTEPCVVWAALVGESGTLKSPALDLAMNPAKRRQAQAIAEHEEAEKGYERDKALHEADRKAWMSKGRAKNEPPPEPPTEPTCIRHYCGDTTIEALAVMLQANPRGVLLSRDELSGWLKSFDQYRNGKGGDTAHWLSMFGARDVLVDRKGNGQRPIYCPRAAVSIIGGIQPGTLRHALGLEHFQNGMAARLLLAMPPSQPKRWTDAAVDHNTLRAMQGLYDGLCDLPMNADADGHPHPAEIGLSADGKAAWIDWYNQHARRLADATGDHAAMLAKIEAYAARLALLVHLIRVVAGDPTVTDEGQADGESIRAGTTLADWYAGEGERVYGVLGENDEQREQRALIELIRRKGGSTSSRDLRHHGFGGDTEGAERALCELVKAGVGQWENAEPGPQGGRPTRIFTLAEANTKTETPLKPEENIGFGFGADTNDEINAVLAEAAAEYETADW